MKQQNAGFVAAMLDLSFSEFITTRIIKVVYVLMLLMAALWGLALMLGGIMKGGMGAIGGLIMGPLVFVLSAIGARIYMELVIVFFRIAENTDAMARSFQKPAGD